MPKSEKPKIKITGKATASGGGKNKPTLKLNQYGQPVKSKTASKPGTISNALALKAQKLRNEAESARKSLVQAQMKSAANPKSKMPKGSTTQKLQDVNYEIYAKKKATANRVSLDRGRTAARGANAMNNALKPKKK
jgi:hypothetical protein